MLAPRSLAGRRAGCGGRGSMRRGTARSATSAASASSPFQSSSSAAAAAAGKKAKALPSLCQISFPLSFSLARARLACSPRLPVACNGSSSSDGRDVSVAGTSAAAADGGAGSGTTPSAASAASSAPTTTATGDAKTQPPPPPPPQLSAGLKPFHLAAFVAVLGAGLAFLAVLLYFTAGIQFNLARDKVVKRLLKTVALRQVLAIAAAMSFVRFGLEPLCKALRTAFNAQGPWEKSSEYYILREVYRPLEFLFSVAAVTTLAENFLPQLISLPKAMVQTVVRSTLSLTFVLAAARVVFNIKGRVTREAAWKLELSGDLTKQRRVEAVDKLLSVLFLLVTSVLGLQAVGLDVNSVLAIGGVGGLAVGLAGREILENLFTGLIILSSSPFEVGDEVQFTPPSGGAVEGIVIDVGWYRTTIRSFEREVFNIPNSVFSRNVVLNVTRKAREWRFYERLYLRVEDAVRCPGVVADMRKVLRADPRIIQKLHRRVFLERVDRDQATVYVSFYVEAANRDQFMAIKQDLLLAFLDCVEQNGAALARNRLVVAVEAAGGTTGLPLAAALALPAARGGLGFTASSMGGGGGGGNGGGGGGGSKSGIISTPAVVSPATTDAATQTTTTTTTTATAAAPSVAPAAAAAASAAAPAAASAASTSGGAPAVDVASNVVPKGTTSGASSKPAVAAAAAAKAAPAATTTTTTTTSAAAAAAPATTTKAAGTSPVLPDDVVLRSFDGSVVNASFDDVP